MKVSSVTELPAVNGLADRQRQAKLIANLGNCAKLNSCEDFADKILGSEAD